MRACAVGKKISSYITLIFFPETEFFAVDLWPKLEVQRLINKKKNGGIVTQKLFLYPFAANQGDWIIKQVIQHCKEINLFTSFFSSRDLKTDKQSNVWYQWERIPCKRKQS